MMKALLGGASGEDLEIPMVYAHAVYTIRCILLRDGRELEMLFPRMEKVPMTSGSHADTANAMSPYNVCLQRPYVLCVSYRLLF